MINYKWYNGEVPKDIEIKQVYGIVFNEDGKIFLRIDDGIYKLTGGRPEIEDKSMEDTLRREFIEEANMTLKNIHILGYQLVDEENGVKPYAQVRMIAKIDEIFENRPDLDNGKTYERVFKMPEEAIELLNWGEVGKSQIEEAVKLAKKYYRDKEIERKYLIKQMPNLDNIKPIRYERYYINDDIDNQIRVQKKDDKFILETKTKISKIEYEREKKEISELEFLKLIKGCEKVIIRDSYLVNEKPNITIKIYHGIYEGLVRAEIEFDSEYEYNNFQVPDWFGKDITDTELGMDARLIKLDRKMFLDKLRMLEK